MTSTIGVARDFADHPRGYAALIQLAFTRPGNHGEGNRALSRGKETQAWVGGFSYYSGSTCVFGIPITVIVVSACWLLVHLLRAPWDTSWSNTNELVSMGSSTGSTCTGYRYVYSVQCPLRIRRYGSTNLLRDNRYRLEEKLFTKLPGRASRVVISRQCEGGSVPYCTSRICMRCS